MSTRRPPRRPDHPCPDCGTAELTYGRAVCQACTVLRLMNGAPR